MLRLLLFFSLLSQLSAEKILIITSAYNRPDFIEIQYKTFQKFLQDDYEFVVFNDARTLPMQQAIESTCAHLGISCVNIPQAIHDLPYLKRLPTEGFHDPAVRNANVVQYALNNRGYAHNGIVAIIDSDMFLVKPFSIEQFLNGYDIAGVPQAYSKDGIKIEYLWIGIAFLNMAKLPEKELINFNCGKIHGVNVDAGGYTYYYLHKYPALKINLFSALHSTSLSCPACRSIRDHYPCNHNRKEFQASGLNDQQIDFLHAGLENVEFFINGTFFHYRSGSNWDHRTKEFHETKTRLFNDYLQSIL